MKDIVVKLQFIVLQAFAVLGLLLVGLVAVRQQLAFLVVNDGCFRLVGLGENLKGLKSFLLSPETRF